MAQCPCRYCKERYEACHDYCDKYKEWKKPFIEQYANRKRLQKAMVRGGFVPIDNEWWHFTLADEPYPDTYFEFPVASAYLKR